MPKFRFKKTSKTVVLALFCLILMACNANNEAADDSRLNVVVTTGQIADAVENIAGDKVDLVNLMGPGVDPHLYVPTEGDVSSLSSAELIIWNGLNLEAQMERVLDQMSSRGTTVLAVGDIPDKNLLLDDGPYPDPHIWNDPEIWMIAVRAIGQSLADADPDNADAYLEATGDYILEISETNDYVTAQFSTIPDDKRVLITAHDAFGYLGSAFDFEVLGVQGLSTESEAGIQDVTNLANLIVERQIPAIFIESSVPQDTIEAVQEAVRAQDFDVQIGGSLYSDALAPEGDPADNYIGMLRHNADTIAAALGE